MVCYWMQFFNSFQPQATFVATFFVFVAGNVPDLSFEMKKLSPKVVSNPQSRKGHSAKMAGAGHRRHCIKAKTQVLAEMSLRSLRQEALAQRSAMQCLLVKKVTFLALLLDPVDDMCHV